MKTLTVQVASEQLTRLIAEANPGDAIVLTDGDKRVVLEASAADCGHLPVDAEEDSPELADELLKAAHGPFTPYSRRDLETIAQQVLSEKNRE